MATSIKWVAQAAARALPSSLRSGGGLQQNPAGNCAKTWSRYLNVHEYQGAQRMAGFGVNVPPGIVAFSVPEAVEAAKKMDGGSGEVRLTSCFSFFSPSSAAAKSETSEARFLAVF